MKLTTCWLLLSAIVVPAQAADSCETLKAEIAAKIEAKGVKIYTLAVVPADQVQAEQKVVGSCGGGKSKIVYRRGQQV